MRTLQKAFHGLFTNRCYQWARVFWPNNFAHLHTAIPVYSITFFQIIVGIMRECYFYYSAALVGKQTWKEETMLSGLGCYDQTEVLGRTWFSWSWDFQSIALSTRSMALDTLTFVAKCNDPRSSLLSIVFIIGRRARVAPFASLASDHIWERHLGTRDHKENWNGVNTNIWTKS